MAFPLNNIILLLQFLPILLYVSLFSRTNSTTPLDDVCQQTIDQAFCLKLFSAYPGTKNASLPVLAETAIGRAQIDAAAAEKRIHTLMLLAKDPQLKILLQGCENSYVDALNALRIAPDDLKRGLYRDLRLHAGQVFDAAKRCESSFTSPTLRSPVTLQNTNLWHVGDIIGVIADRLSSGKRVG